MEVAPFCESSLLFESTDWQSVLLIPPRQKGQQPEDFNIKPNQGDQQAHRRKPFHVAGCAVLFALVKIVEVEQQVESCNADDDHADADAHRSALVQIREVDAEKAEDKI